MLGNEEEGGEGGENILGIVGLQFLTGEGVTTVARGEGVGEAWLVCRMFPWFDVACVVVVFLTSSCCRLTKRMTCIFMRYMRNELFVVVADAAADASAAAGGNTVRGSNSSTAATANNDNK